MLKLSISLIFRNPEVSLLLRTFISSVWVSPKDMPALRPALGTPYRPSSNGE